MRQEGKSAIFKDIEMGPTVFERESDTIFFRIPLIPLRYFENWLISQYSNCAKFEKRCTILIKKFPELSPGDALSQLI